MEETKIVLATSSKFKSGLLKTAGIEHTCMESFFEEISDKTDIYEWAKEIAYGKAVEVANKEENKNKIVIGVDTVVYKNGKTYTKPKSREEVFENMQELQNGVGSVITGVCIINNTNNKVIKTYCETKVHLDSMTESEINYYIDNEEYVLNTSGYVVENILSRHINKIEGSYVNILGMPAQTIYKALKEIR